MVIIVILKPDSMVDLGQGLDRILGGWTQVDPSQLK
jgi:hypothetical protein